LIRAGVSRLREILKGMKKSGCIMPELSLTVCLELVFVFSMVMLID